jgi:DNA polymerase III subunit delta'
MIYPWQTYQWQHWYQAIANNKLPHAILLSGLAGLGQLAFAENMVKSLFCTHAALSNERLSDKNCLCHACQLLAGDVHPNVLRVQPEKPGLAIKVDEIRIACEFLSQTAIHGQYRFVIIQPANKMNINAANALLKTLEEPSPHAILILISDQEGALPPTVLSRCRRIVFARPNTETALAWLTLQLDQPELDLKLLLKLAHGAPLKAYDLANQALLKNRTILHETLIALGDATTHPVAAAAKVQKLELIDTLDGLLTWVKDLIHLKLNTGFENLINQDVMTPLSRMSALMSQKSLIQFLYTTLRYREQIEAGLNFNRQLLIETLFFHFQECRACS